MSIQDWGAVGEIVGAIGVVVSLVYLALQMRMNTKALRANAAWDSELSFGNGNLEIAANPELSLLFSRAGNTDARPEDFSEAEMAQLYFSVRSALQIAQAQWWLWRSGSLPDSLWEYRRRWARNFVSAPALRPIWESELEQHIFSEEFVRDVLSTEKLGELSTSPGSLGSSSR